MKITSKIKYVKISPKKIYHIAKDIKGQKVKIIKEILDLMPNKGCKLILNALNSAIANAENNFNLNKSNLLLKNILIEQGPTLKRFRPSAKGSAHPYKKKMSHISIILETI